MGLFDFLKPRAEPAPAMPNDLIFKSGTHAIEYVKECMLTEWKPNSVAVALVGHAKLIEGTLYAKVLVPQRDGFVQLETGTTIKAVHSKDKGRVPVNELTDISVLGLKSGDLVTMMLCERSPELVNLLPDNFDGWVAIIIGKALPIYSLHDGGWRMEKKYEL
ncbi:MAG: hypothetical protein ACLPWS_09985 [Rhodomicrobium sp.]